MVRVDDVLAGEEIATEEEAQRLVAQLEGLMASSSSKTDSESKSANSLFTPIVRDIHAQQREKGYLNLLKDKFDIRVTSRVSSENKREGVVSKITQQALFDLCKILFVPIDGDAARKVGSGGFVSFEEFVHTVIQDKTNSIMKVTTPQNVNFHSLSLTQQYTRLNALKRFFDEYDIDGDGHIKSSEMASIFHQHTGKTMDRAVLHELMAAGDLDGDGVVDFEEYVMMMCKDLDQLETVSQVTAMEGKLMEQASVCKSLRSFIKTTLQGASVRVAFK